MRNHKLLTTVFGLLSLGSVACGSGTQAGDDDGYNGTVSPGSGNAAPDAAVPAGCDATKTPSQDACVVNETLGIFVAAPNADAGADPAADGTRAHPFAKMQDAIDAAKTAKKRVYACVGSYAEQITIAEGVSMFGNLDCNQGWSVVSDRNASLSPAASPVAHAEGISTPTRIEHVDFVAPDGSAGQPHSIAVTANASPALVIANARIHAGVGFNGTNGVEGIALSNASSTNGPNGIHEHKKTSSEDSCSSMPSSSNACAGASGIQGGAGGQGGWGGHWIVELSAGGSYQTYAFSPPAGVACPVTRPCVCKNANGGSQPASEATAQGAYIETNGTTHMAVAGANGANGTSGMSATASFGIDTAGNFEPGDGTVGTDGAPGQGGGGGAGKEPDPQGYTAGDELIGGAGAGGGAGGCPGLAGTPGKAGGSSIAILAADSPLMLDTCIVQASNAGDGGEGTFGSNPTNGGTAGTNFATQFYTSGANGGAGGNAGWSGSGAGGSSIAIAFRGGQIRLINSVPTTGSAGHGVTAMTSASKTIPASAAGVSGLSVSF